MIACFPSSGIAWFGIVLVVLAVFVLVERVSRP